MASHPTYDPNKLAEERSIFDDPDSPLVNRATQGSYLAGSALDIFEQVEELEAGKPVDEALRAEMYEKLGFYVAPALPLQAAPPARSGTTAGLTLSPMQMALAAATLSGTGSRPPAWIALAADTPTQGWVILPASGESTPVFLPESVQQTVESHAAKGTPYWESLGSSNGGASPVTWYLAGTLPDWPGTPLVAVVALEQSNPALAEEIGRAMLDAATSP